jgi:hypothetical protein
MSAMIQTLARVRFGILIAALVLQTSACLATTGKTPPPTQFRVLKAQFGVLDPWGSANPGFRPSTKVPLKEGQVFGWMIELESKSQTVRWREEIRLPAAPAAWRSDDKEARHTLSADRRTSVLEREQRLEDGMIYSFWQLEPGDPKGRYSIRVMVEGLLVSSFDFEVD